MNAATTVPAAVIPPADWLTPTVEHPAIEYLRNIFGHSFLGTEEDNNVRFLQIHPTTKVAYEPFPTMTVSEAASDKIIKQLTKDQDEKGLNCYVSMGAFPSGTLRRKEEFVVAPRNVFIESDNTMPTLALIKEAVAAGEIPVPHSILESSPNKYHVCWHVEGMTPSQAKSLNCTLREKFGGDIKAVDLARVLRMPGFRNLKYAEKPFTRLVEEHQEIDRYYLSDFKIPMVSVTAAAPCVPIKDDELKAKVEQLEANAREVKFNLGPRHADDNGGYYYDVLCPWAYYHGTPGDTARIMVLANGKLEFNCFHSHSGGPTNQTYGWSNIRALWEAQAGKKLKFGEPPAEITSSSAASVISASEMPLSAIDADDVDEMSEDAIPAFDPTVINGIYAKFVELVTRNTTLVPQFAYVIAKTIVGARMAGKVKFENLDAEPRYYTALIGETGSGKGTAWHRTESILNSDGADGSKLKVIHSLDSGAGIKDYFFQPPRELPVVCYLDEIVTLGNKASDSRNPGIIDTMIELADSTTISRILATRDGRGSKSMPDARLSMVICGQSGLVYARALTGRTEYGLWDRLYPEFSTPVPQDDSPDMPPIDVADARRLLHELNHLDYSGTIAVKPLAKERLRNFWKSQPPEIRRKVRWHRNLQIDAFMSAFGRGLKTVELEDMDIAIRIFERQVVIRRVCFTTEVPDRNGVYVSGIKQIVERMKRQLDKKGNSREAKDQISMSKRDFERATHAYRNNETVFFNKAWNNCAPNWLVSYNVIRSNGQTYPKFLPAEDDPFKPRR